MITYQIIAALCQINSGNGSMYTDTVNAINLAQMECHSFYAKCLKNKPFDECIITRFEEEIKKKAKK